MTTAPTDPNPERVVFDLALTDLPPAFVDSMWQIGVREPALARLITIARLPAFEIGLYVAAGCTSEHEMREHWQANLSGPAAYALHHAGHTSPAAQRRFRRLHWNPPEHRVWFNAGIFDPDHIARLGDAGVSPKYAYHCTRSGYTTPDTIIALRDAHVPEEHLPRYRRAGAATAADVIDLYISSRPRTVT